MTDASLAGGSRKGSSIKEEESLKLRGLNKDDLIPLTYEDEDDDWVEKDSIHVVSSTELADIIEQQDVILNF